MEALGKLPNLILSHTEMDDSLTIYKIPKNLVVVGATVLHMLIHLSHLIASSARVSKLFPRCTLREHNAGNNTRGNNTSYKIFNYFNINECPPMTNLFSKLNSLFRMNRTILYRILVFPLVCWLKRFLRQSCGYSHITQTKTRSIAGSILVSHYDSSNAE